jgi:hypothetical protein
MKRLTLRFGIKRRRRAVNELQRQREEQEELRREFERQAEVRRIDSFKDYSVVPVVSFADIEFLKRIGIAW